MNIEDPQPEPAPQKESTIRPWFGRRKKVVSTEVATHAPQVTQNPTADSIRPTDVIDIPSSVPPSAQESIIDPTLFSQRQRRPGQNFAYHLTQALVAVAILTASAGIVGTLMDHRLRALIIAGTGAVCSIIAFVLVKRSRLAHRLRGYVAAACVLSLLSMGACFFMPNFLHGPHSADEADPTPATKRR
jgi:hypothetical protein